MKLFRRAITLQLYVYASDPICDECKWAKVPIFKYESIHEVRQQFRQRGYCTALVKCS